MKNDQKLMKKRSISASEYIELEQNRREDMKKLVSTRLCSIDEGIYMVIDYYGEVDGQPLTCIIQINEEEHKKHGDKKIKLPPYL